MSHRSLTQPLSREAYSEIGRLKNMSRLPLIPPSIEQQIPNFQRDARHVPDAAPAAVDALRDSFSSYEMYVRNHSTSGSFRAPIQYPKQAAAVFVNQNHDLLLTRNEYRQKHSLT